MSQIRTLQVSIKNLSVLKKCLAAKGIGLKAGADGRVTEKIYNRRVTGVASFQLPGWTFPCVVKADGTLTYDNHNGGWGDLEDLNEINRQYALQSVVGYLEQEEAMRVVGEQQVLEDGSLVVELCD